MCIVYCVYVKTIYCHNIFLLSIKKKHTKPIKKVESRTILVQVHAFAIYIISCCHKKILYIGIYFCITSKNVV